MTLCSKTNLTARQPRRSRSLAGNAGLCSSAIPAEVRPAMRLMAGSHNLRKSQRRVHGSAWRAQAEAVTLGVDFESVLRWYRPESLLLLPAGVWRAATIGVVVLHVM